MLASCDTGSRMWKGRPQMSRFSPAEKVEADVADLAALSRGELAERWRTRFGHEPPKGCGRTFLELAEAYALQAAAVGPLKPGLRRQLKGEVPGSGKCSPARKSKNVSPLKPGTHLVREWNGRTHHVDVIAGGFVWNGARHRSLSAIAREITGVRWSGPRFFGL
jgi:Protein of unknown function (DUF2924)